MFLDIETSPNKVWRFNLYDRAPVGHDQVIEPVRMLCFAAKWRGAKRTEFRSEFHHGHEAMVIRAHELLDEADVLVHYNGKRFDVPHLNREFLLAGLRPPAPYQHVDLWQVVSKRFEFPSSKLAYVLKALGLSSKVTTGGFSLWQRCLDGDPKAWALMRRYNVRDVTALEELYECLLPWISGHPSRVLSGELACPVCGSASLQRRGYQVTQVSRYQRYQCQECGSWARETRRESGAQLREVAA